MYFGRLMSLSDIAVQVFALASNEKKKGFCLFSHFSEQAVIFGHTNYLSPYRNLT